MVAQDTLGLIEGIYASALDPSRLPQTLVRIGEAVGGVQECFVAQAPHERTFMLVAPRRDPVYTQSLRDDWPQRGDDAFDRFAALLQAAPAGRAFDIRRLVEGRRFAHSAFYNDWWRAQNLGQATLMVPFTAHHGAWGLFGVHSPRQRNDFTREQTALLNAVAPHLVRATSVQHELACLAFEREARLPPDTPGRGVFLVDADGRVVLANPVAEGWLRDGRRLRVQNGRLKLPEPRATDALTQLVSGCVRSPRQDKMPGGTLSLACGGEPDALHIEVAPFLLDAAPRDLGWLALFRPAAVLLVCDRAEERRQRRTALRRRFVLTPMEAAVALEMLRGDGREAIAARMGVSVATVRTHLTHLFDKTGVRRQAELVRILTEESRPRPR